MADNDDDVPAPSFDATLNEAQRAQQAAQHVVAEDEAGVVEDDTDAVANDPGAEEAEAETSVASIDKLAVPRSQLHSATLAPAGWQERTLPHRDANSAGGGPLDADSVTPEAANAVEVEGNGNDEVEVAEAEAEAAHVEEIAVAAVEENNSKEVPQQQQQEEEAVVEEPEERKDDNAATTNEQQSQAAHEDVKQAEDRQLVVRVDAASPPLHPPTHNTTHTTTSSNNTTTTAKATQPLPPPRRPSRRPSQHQQESLNALMARRLSMLEGGLTTGPHLNALQMTPAEEYALFRRRNHVVPTYKGPIYVAEDVQVGCHACGCPVDPVRRVPAGQLFFHPHCIACCLCGRRGEAEPFRQVGDFVICSFCAERGYARCVPRTGQRVARGQAMASLPHYVTTSTHGSSGAAGDEGRSATCTVNLPSLPGVTAPSLAINAQLHTSRNTSRRSFALMQRQQYYTQNDVNVMMQPPQQQHGTSGSRKASTVAAIGAAPELRALKMRRASQA